jgi:hypothetical protein
MEITKYPETGIGCEGKARREQSTAVHDPPRETSEEPESRRAEDSEYEFRIESVEKRLRQGNAHEYEEDSITL